MYLSCSFTGNHPHELSWAFDDDSKDCKLFLENLKSCIRFELDYGVRHFLCCLNTTLDLDFAKMILNWKHEFNCGITLECILPQDRSCLFSDEKHKARFNEILKQCDKVFNMEADKEKDYIERCNLYMLENSDMMFVAWDGNSETAPYQTIRLANKMDKVLRFIKL